MKKVRSALNTALIFVFVLLSAATVQAQSRAENALIVQAERVSGDRFEYFAQTRKGARIYSVNRPTSQMLNAIDNGLHELFVLARKNGYNRRLNYFDYTIFIGRADRIKDGQGHYSPGIAVNAGQYAGSIYDQGGYIFAAGMVIGYHPNAFLIAEHTQDLHRISEVVRYEGEHLVLYHNDRRRYRQTADHSQGGGHPILK